MMIIKDIKMYSCAPNLVKKSKKKSYDNNEMRRKYFVRKGYRMKSSRIIQIFFFNFECWILQCTI